MIDETLWALAHSIATAIPGRILNAKCGRTVHNQVVVMAIYKVLEAKFLDQANYSIGSHTEEIHTEETNDI